MNVHNDLIKHARLLNYVEPLWQLSKIYFKLNSVYGGDIYKW